MTSKRFAALVGLVLLAAACSHKSDPSAASPVANFAEVAPGLYRGAQPDADGFRALRDMGVKTIVDLRGKHDDAKDAEPLGLSVVRIPMSSFPSIDPPTDAEIRSFLDVASDPARRPVFVHCAEGKDRTGVMCALWRIERDGWTPERALEEMRSFGYHETLYGNLAKFVLARRPAAAPAAK
jgi:tyrosine-protein phosphatase SIW14